MNIYTLNGKHIGKRFAAGIWCWDCKKEASSEHHYFCKQHEEELKSDVYRYAKSCPKCQVCILGLDIVNNPYRVPEEVKHRTKFFCSICQKSKWHDEIGFNPVFRELGFDKDKSNKHTGIDGASGFIWAIGEDGIKDKSLKRIKKVKTEYGQKWTKDEFKQMFNDIITESDSDSEYFS